MSMDGVVPPQSGPSRRPSGGPADENPARAARPDAAAGRGAGRGFGEQSTPWTPGPHSGHGQDQPAYDRGQDQDQTAARVPGPTGHSGGQQGPHHSHRRPVPAQGGAALPDDLGAALRSRVAVIGVAGPPSDGLRVIHHKAGIRRRNRRIAAGGAAVALFGVGLTLATGGVSLPALTGGGSSNGVPAALGPSASSGSDGGAQADGAGGRVVWPSIGSGKTGPAVGPVPPITATPSAAVAANLPLCTAASLITTTTLGPTVDGVAYGHVDAVAQSSCVVVGPPVVSVANQTGDAASSVLILRENPAVAPMLPQVPTWGTTMVLHPGSSFEFQFAWATAQCPTASASPAASPTPPGSTTYTLGYAATGTTPTATVTLTAQCGADVFVTDIYHPGSYPLPSVATASASPSAPDSGAPSSNAPAPPSSPAPSDSSAAPSSSANGLIATSSPPSS